MTYLNTRSMADPSDAARLPEPAAPTGPVVELCDLHKRFGSLEVLRGVDAMIAGGRITAVVGPNASGKTTLIKILLGLVRPDRGRLLIDGTPVDAEGRYRSRIGYMPQAAAFPDNLTGREVLTMLHDLRGSGTVTDESLIEAFRMNGELQKPLRTLSGGTRQKVSAAAAFLFRPNLIVLDEPTAGLDPVASSLLKHKIRTAAAEGCTVLLTSHIMSEIEELADDLIFLLNGQIQFQGAVEAVKQRTEEPTLERAVARLMETPQP